MAKGKSGGNPRTIPEGKAQVNFNLSTASLDKVKFIVFAEGVKSQKAISNSDIYQAAVDEYIERYEKKNGKIKLPK